MSDVRFVGLLKWRTAGGVVVEERGRRREMDRKGRVTWKISAWKASGGFHGWLWLRNLTPVEE